MNRRFFIRKKPAFRQHEAALAASLSEDLGVSIPAPAIYQVYDVFAAGEAELRLLADHVFSDFLVDELVPESDLAAVLGTPSAIGVTPLEGQYDARSDAAEQCLGLLAPDAHVNIRSAQLYVFAPVLGGEILSRIRTQLINPVDSQEKDFTVLREETAGEADALHHPAGFLEMDRDALQNLIRERGLAMSAEDLALVQKYFRTEGRAPTEVELRVLDTYWSDHCRHTTFNTELLCIRNESVRFHSDLERILKRCEEMRAANGRSGKPVTLMELATIMGRDLRGKGLLDSQEVSDEINACSVRVRVSTENGKEPWLLMFKNETHNHPTEIEPFGGASTCLGGAIRDPLSGRAYVYQAMRISGAGDISTPLKETPASKLPQRVISRGACAGYSSYGNQIGLATTFVRELVHPGYVAKRLELGAVAAAVPASSLRREDPRPGDLVVLVGGRTGRDGIGGATGSSKAHTKESLRRSGAEVQKGNPVCERKLQRLFKRPEVARLIRKCNDFGAGGVSVAVGELADGLDIDLDRVPLKYSGLNAMEIAISESQERMAVLLAPEDADAFIRAAAEENLEAVILAEVNGDKRLRMTCRGETVLDIDRSFLDSNGAARSQEVIIRDLPEGKSAFRPLPECTRDTLLKHLAEANHGSQEGMTEQFDSSIGRSTVLMPLGGRFRKTEEQVSAQTFPVPGGSRTASLMAYGYQPALADDSPYLMGAYSVIEALSKLAAAGADTEKAWLSCQEFFRRLGEDPEAWGTVTAALLGALEAQDEFRVAAIGGKDSMSGSFEDLHVPPTLVTFAVACAEQEEVIPATLPEEELFLCYLPHQADREGRPDYEGLRKNFRRVRELARSAQIRAASAIRGGGLFETIVKMTLGNRVGFCAANDRFMQDYPAAGTPLGGIVLAMPAGSRPGDRADLVFLGRVSPDLDRLHFGPGLDFSFDELEQALEEAYGKVYPVRRKPADVPELPEFARALYSSGKTISTGASDSSRVVRVLLPVFPGGNCEFDTMEAFRAAGAECEIHLIRNLNAQMAGEDLEAFLKKLQKSDILAFSGGFSFGDEPDGSAKFIVNFLRSARVKAAVRSFTANGGLVLGICNGFQALLKSGFLPYGDPDLQTADSPTLFHNIQGRHISRVIRTRVASNRSPWLSSFTPGEIHTLPVSHGEGRLMISEEEAKRLFANGQVAFQYADENGEPAPAAPDNPNGSAYAIEGLLSPDGRILGKMGHSERYREGLMKNIPGIAVQNIFANAVRYVRGLTQKRAARRSSEV